MVLLIPNKLRIAGWIILLLGTVLGAIRFYFVIKPEIFNIKVFAVYSKYFETNYFKVISNHFSEEATALLLLMGLLLVAFTREKVEDENVSSLRLKSFLLTFYINTFLLIFSFLFIYGFVFINVIVINIFSPLVIYIILFKYFSYKQKLAAAKQKL